MKKLISIIITNCFLFSVQGVIVFNDQTPIEIRLPSHMHIKVVKTDPGEKGNTAQGGTKPATLETGAVIHVPLFIQIGDIVRVDTRDKRYLERVK